MRMTFYEDKKKSYPKNRFGVLEVENVKMKNNRPGLMVKDMKKMKKEWTFLLCYPSIVGTYRIVGKVLTEIQKMNLNIIGMRLMCGSSEFVHTHFHRDGRDPCPDDSVRHLIPHPFVAMILEGENAIQKVHQFTSSTSPFWNSAEPEAYSSRSYETALEDYELWFDMDSDNWKEEEQERNLLAFAFPDGTEFGPTAEVMENILRVELFITLEPKFADNFYTEDLYFLLIRPLAFQKQCVGEVLSSIERGFFHVKGLKLVRKSEVPHSNAWLANCSSSSEIKEDEYGIAMLVRHIKADRIQIVNNGDGCIRKVNNNEKTEICSNLVYLDKPGDRENIGAFFEFGCVSWVDPTSRANCGGLFLATLSSL
ncbi:hypothetical protein MKW94_028900 [Papaver nudicaule]|uniref:nucleoside-diphosphate kinase n=1 Tax=Papaver nudicaule TaxID=74823 RepID=A0AA41SKV7_PAPNU|nr:hypothetical protein [Papaver nudicaule]